jgi:hypothetical protein
LRTTCYLLIAGATLLALAGCRRDRIETHRVEIPQPPEPKVRLLGAMVPHDKDMWFFKVVGKLDAIEPLQAPFEEFVRSVRFDRPGEPIAWTLPAGWERLNENKSEERYATLRAGAKDDAPQLTVHRFPAAGQMADPEENVVRWGRMYAGVKVPVDEWRQYTHDDKTAEGDVAFTFVDMKGPGPKAGAAMPPFAGGANPHGRAEKISYTAPEGWKEADRVVERGGIRVDYDVALKLEKDGRTADLTVSKFPGGGTDLLLPNVNRWRTLQLGLPPLDADQLRDATKKVKVGDADGLAVDFTGPGAQPGKGQRRILVAVVSRPGTTWFFKMDGPADLVGGQKAAFDKFLGSVKFDGGNGG